MSVAAADKTRSTADITYEDLYRRWENNNWKAHEIDFAQDRAGWESLSDIQRRSAMWIYSMFFYGEDAVADGLSPYIAAAPTEEQAYFLTTQQVDEARHAVFFNRFFNEVIGAGAGSIGEGLEITTEYLGWGYRGVFGRLERMVEELKDDRSIPKYAQAIALYHLVVEATLAQPGQHYIEDFFAKAATMPGFTEGMENIARDEQRHIGFGVKVLSELVKGPEAEECKAAIAELLRDVMPYAVGVFVPPNWDLEYTRSFGFELEDIYAFGMKSVEMKWRMIGYPLEEMPGVYPFDTEMPHRERAERQIALLKAGVVGEPNGKPEVNPEVQRYLFDVIARSADTSQVDRPVTYQWKFSDEGAEPWHVRIDNGATRAEPGLAEKADVTLRTSWSDWIDASIRGGDPRKFMARGKIRPSGSIRQLMRMRHVFPSREQTTSVELNGAR